MKTKVLVATSLLMLTVVSFAWAPYPTLKKVYANFVGDGSANLKVTWEEVNLPSNVYVHYAVNGNVTATYTCVSSNGRCSNSTQEVSQPILLGGTFLSSRRGVIIGSLQTQDIPDPPSTFTCAGGQTMVLSSIHYRPILLQDTTNGPSQLASPVAVEGDFACN